jgi:putative membrane protein
LQFEIRSRPSNDKGAKALVTQWLINAIALVLVARWVSGVQLDSGGTEGLLTVLGASAVLGLLNLLLKPFLLLVTLPINILTLGLFTLVINGGVLALTSKLVKGFEVDGFWPAVIGALLLSVLSLVLGSLFGNFALSFKATRGGGE